MKEKWRRKMRKRQKYSQRKCEESEGKRKRKEADTTHLELSTEGKGLGGGGQKTSFNREHEYLSSLGAVGVFFCFFCCGFWSSVGGRRVRLGDRRSHRERCGI